MLMITAKCSAMVRTGALELPLLLLFGLEATDDGDLLEILMLVLLLPSLEVSALLQFLSLSFSFSSGELCAELSGEARGEARGDARGEICLDDDADPGGVALSAWLFIFADVTLGAGWNRY